MTGVQTCALPILAADPGGLLTDGQGSETSRKERCGHHGRDHDLGERKACLGMVPDLRLCRHIVHLIPLTPLTRLAR